MSRLIPIFGAMVVVVVMAMTWFRMRYDVEPLPVIAEVPPFSLVERSGKTVTNADLAGKVWLASFVYSTCPGPCPEISANVSGMKDEVLAVSPGIRMVTVTLDPQKDTIEILKKYAAALGANADWWFLTGDVAAVERLVTGGFKVAVSRPEGEPIIHGTQLALVDGRGRIRAYYDGAGAAEKSRILADVKQLVRE